MMEIEVEEQTKAEALIARQNWVTKRAGADHVAIQTCPHCHNENFKFYMHIGGEKDGMWDCKVCGKNGNYWQLRDHVGGMTLHSNGLLSLKEAVQSKQPPSALPDFDAAHRRLLSERGEHAMLYLLNVRKWSLDVIKRFKIGAWDKVNKQTGQSCEWVVIPYIDSNGKPCYYKARTIPPDKKGFDSPAGYEAPLFNESALKHGLDELFMVEGEPDCLAALSNGLEHVVGVPGAGVKKAAWIDKLDSTAPKRIYLIYDRDKAGQDGARAMASRIGLDKCYNVLLPEFLLPDGTPGKDVNDWFVSGHTLEELRELIAASRMFDIAGVQNLADVLGELEKDLEERGADPKYLTPWPSLTRKVGGFEPGDLVGIMAEGKVGKTTLALNWLHYYADIEGRNVFNFCLEMPTKRTVRKWASFVMQTDDTPGRSKMTVDTIRDAVSYAASMKADMLLGYSKDRDIKAVLETIRQVVRRYGVEIVCFDHLHLLCQSVEHQAQEIAKYIIAFKNLAMELNIVILLIVQPNRVAEGSIVGARNAMGSSTIEKLVDYMICLHRKRVADIKQAEFKGFLETEDNLEPQMLARVDLARYAPGGCCTLYMDGAKSTVRECVESETIVRFGSTAAIPVESNDASEVVNI